MGARRAHQLPLVYAGEYLHQVGGELCGGVEFVNNLGPQEGLTFDMLSANFI